MSSNSSTVAESPEMVEEVLNSPSWYLGEFRATEQRARAFANLGSSRRLKDLLLPALYWTLGHAPAVAALAPLQAIIVLVRLLYWAPGNPLRQSCEDICRIAARQGHEHSPGTIYRQFLTNLIVTAKGYQLLLGKGRQAALPRFHLKETDRQKSDDALKQYGGFTLACPHNPACVYSAIKLNMEMPLLIVTKNSSTIRRTRLALDVFERMHTKILMVRNGNPFELARTMFAALKDNKVLAATVDNVDRGSEAVAVQMFGQQVPLSAWAARIAVKKGVPVLPSYYRVTADGVCIEFGNPRVSKHVEEAMQHYASFFEQSILKDPANWAYLADRKWREVLRRAAGCCVA
ncbi:MAG: hypothetical protein ACR2RB_23095 [Gammaproteobacteria bacterium]